MPRKNVKTFISFIKFDTYTNATGKKTFLKTDDIHSDTAYILQPEKSSQHSFNSMALEVS